MKQFLSSLSPRDRKLGIAGGLLLIIFILVTAWTSFSNKVEHLEEIVIEQRTLDSWMQASAQEVKRLRGVAVSDSGTKPSLLVLADTTARQGGLGAAIKRVEPDGEDRVTIRLEKVSFDDMVRWLENLYSDNSVQVNNVSIDRQEQSGLVNARITLEWF